MKKSDLKATLGAVRANEELVKKTMKRIEERSSCERERQIVMTPFAFGSRLAAAVCAFALVITASVWAMKNDMFSEDTVEYTPRRAAETLSEIPKSSTASKDGGSDFGILAKEAETVDGKWAIFGGTANAFYFAEGENEEGKRRCIVSVTVERLGESSGVLLEIGDELIAEAYFSLDDEVQKFTDSISSEVSVLIEKNGEGNDQYWTVKKIIY